MYELKLTREQKILLNLAARSISDDPSSLVLSKEELEGADWKEIVKESVAQAIPLATFDAVSVYKDYIPENIYDRWKELSVSVLQSNFVAMQAQVELIELMNGNGYPYIILKGTSAAAYYPNPELRALGDIDFLIDPKQRTEVENMLDKEGYARKKGEPNHNHVVFNKPHAHLEMHFDVAGIPYGWRGDEVRTFLKDAVFDSISYAQSGCEFHSPQEMHHCLVLLLHMQHHMLAEGLGLRHLSDWAVCLKMTQERAYWAESLLPFLKKIGLFTYATIMTKVAAKYLRVRCPEWAKSAEEEICDEIMNDILTGGNFGRKNDIRAKSGMLISEHGKAGTKHGVVYNLAHGLHKVVMLRYPILKKWPIFYPFLYGWRALRFLFLSMIGKRPSFIKMRPEAEKRKSIYDKLAIFETEGGK